MEHSEATDIRVDTVWNLTPSLQKKMPVKVRRLKIATHQPQAMCMQIPKLRVGMRSFFFSEDAKNNPFDFRSPEEKEEEKENARSKTPPQRVKPVAPKESTRLQPPRDLIKLEDRLAYLLQPPLQSLLPNHALTFPFEPFPHQFEGVAFLYSRHSAILADEMGLGKTMQAITAIRLLFRTRKVRSVLLVCPKPLVTNWQREFELWAPELPVTVMEGNRDKRQWLWSLPDVPVRLANYELMLRDREFFELPQGGGAAPCHFDLCVLDESQRIKNRSSTTSQVIRNISRSRSWAMTGTPIENSTEDLVSICEFLSPGLLCNEMGTSAMRESVSDLIIRRQKEEVLDMPPRLFRDAGMELGPHQRETYEMAEKDGIIRLTEMGDTATVQHVFELVLRLKQICNFDTATGESPKLDRLKADLEEIAKSGKKAILFSQWTNTIFRLRDQLQEFGPLEYHGKIPSKDRDGILDQFKNDPDKHIILMSYGAGSVGLNLQFCHYVFLFDRWWNPAVEDQAINRAHRIGVDGPVFVSRFLMAGTIEERIDLVLNEKRELAESILEGTDSPSKVGLTQDEVFGLFDLKKKKKAA